MTTPKFTSSAAALSDADLVAASQGGSRDAFGRIVERYQRLLCSLAYSATGSVTESEDMAQEAFITAWRELRDLRDAEKLRSWLCGILRHKIGRLRRGNAREPAHQASGLDLAGELVATEEPAMDTAMHAEEQSILWSELQRVPELYREPLVLYYREHRSVEHVAVALDLSEDAVKQRLARGRKILQERVLAFVETALARSTPSRVFTLGVLAALPEMAVPAKAAGIGAVAAHGGMMAKSAGLAALLASLTGLVNLVLALRASLDQSRTPRERRTVVRVVLGGFLSSFAFILLLYGLRSAAFFWWESRIVFAAICQVLVLAFIAVWPVAMVQMLRHLRRLRSAERRRHPECFRDSRDHVGSAAGEYRSRAKLFGVPLVHLRFSLADEGARPVFGWIAAGDRAYGLLFAWGTCAVAPISVGVVSVGLLSVGALSVGLIGLGTVGVGLLAVGCVTVGMKAFAWLSALGWETAQSSGFAIARIAAEAPVALAQHANDPIAREILANPHAQTTQMAFLMLIVVLSMIPLAAYVRAVRQRLGRDSDAGA